jgi:hypothetical protein
MRHDGAYIVVGHRLVREGFISTGSGWQFTIVHDARFRPVYFQGLVPHQIRDTVISESRLYMRPGGGIVPVDERRAREELSGH